MSLVEAFGGGLIGWASMFSLLLLLIGLAFGLIRLTIGPTLADRVVALDFITVLAVSFIAVLAVATGEPAILDVAIALALVGFLGTVAFARYAERRSLQAKAPLHSKDVQDKLQENKDDR
ncbi:monovalent cation/H+ antiporter complex subunit F [Telmatospirillum sp. J64-1]|uniref:monovalent cation/H+ antiporter complex subunit F n=1 Tax=Telmatospirillum sp. J64-1 TaxID=2502183 RepID=UPI00115EEDF7|nr:cation:proton antiporter [Telmatospirillum sp. J64-1]